MSVSRKPYASSDGLLIVVLGYIIRGPVGGMAWSDLHYFMGLTALGHEVYFIEDSGDFGAVMIQVETRWTPTQAMACSSQGIFLQNSGYRTAGHIMMRIPRFGMARAPIASTKFLLQRT